MALDPAEELPVAGVNHERTPVGVDDDDAPAGTRDPRGFGDEPAEVADVLDDPLHANAIAVCRWKSGVASVALDQLDGDAPRRGPDSRHSSSMVAARVDADGDAVRADDPQRSG